MPLILDIGSIPRRLLDIALPPVCHICREGAVMAGDDDICRPCLTDIEPIAGPLCRLCGSAFPGGATEDTRSTKGKGRLCGECILTAPPFEQALSALTYAGQVRTAIHRFKYGGETRLVKVFASLMQGSLDDLNCASIDLVMPIPLHRRRLTERGFNQSLLLARMLAKKAGVAIDYKSLKRVRHTTPQVELSAKERTTNVKDAFELSGSLQLKAKTVLIVDDVYTTGSTIRECAKILKKAGARVVALTLARAA